VYWTVLCYHPYLVSMLFADLLSLHLVTFLMFFILVIFRSAYILEIMWEIYHNVHHQFIKILNVCVCVWRKWEWSGTTRSSTVMIWASYLLYLLFTACTCMTSWLTHSRSSSWRGRSRGVAAEADTIENSGRSGHNRDAVHYCTRLLVRQRAALDSYRRGEGGEITEA